MRSHKTEDQLIHETMELLMDARFDLERRHLTDAKVSAHDAYINLIEIVSRT